jgi:flavin prenyltransferase
MNRKIIIAVSGASGSIYADLLLKSLEKLIAPTDEVALIFSETAQKVWKYELEKAIPATAKFTLFSNDDLFAAPASGSSGYDCMIIIPCSMGTLARVAQGIADTLIARTADVMLKERKKLILVSREMPYNLIHLKNMLAIHEAGGIICPASPSFYSKPATLEETLQTVIDKVLSLAGFETNSFRWGENHKEA